MKAVSQKKLRTIWFHSNVGYKSETHSHRQQYGGCQREAGREVEEGKGGQIYGHGGWFNFGRWAYNAVYRSCIIEMYTWNLCDPINQRHPSKFNKEEIY